MTDTCRPSRFRDIGGGDVPSSLRVNETDASQLTEIMQPRCDSSSAHSYEVESRKLTKCQITKQENDDFINQNRSNKQNEKLNKPCKNGFCYCFTSDSDEFRLSANSSERHKKQKRSEHTIQGSNKTSKPRRRDSVPPSHKPAKASKSPENKNCFRAISKLERNCVYNSDAPFVHIVQEIRENCFISEVTVNKAKMVCSDVSKNKKSVYTDKEVLAAFNRRRSCPAKTTRDQSTSISEDLTKSTLQTSSKTTGTTKDDSRSTKKSSSISADHSKSTLDTSSKSSGKKGGRLLQKRLSSTEKGFKQLNSNTPPRKPPRQLNYNNSGSEAVTYSTSASVREAEKLLDEFIKSHGKRLPAYTEKTTRNTRKSYPIEKAKKKYENKLFRSLHLHPTPSCPSLSEIESVMQEWKEEKTHSNDASNIGWNKQSIREMLNYEKNSKSNQFKTFQSEAEPQKIGWTVSPKLNIDTVDSPEGRRGHRNEDFHNLAINLESKSTPKKAEINSNELLSSNSKFIIKEQLSNLVSSSPLNKNDSPKLSNSLSNTKLKLSFRKKAKDNTKQFLNSSKKTLRKLVCKDSKTKQLKEPLTTRTTSSQTSVADIVSTSKIRVKSDSNGNRISLQSPPGSYISQESKAKSSNKNSQEEFNFERKIQSPKTARCFQRQLNFTPLKNNRNIDQRLNNALLHHHSYKSFSGDLDRDITMNKMSDILGSIKAKLEASDELAIRTFRDVERREQSYGDSTSEPYARIISARAEIHKTVATETEPEYDPFYSEIEEEGYMVTAKPSMLNLAEISHFIASNDPNAIYAQVNKTPKGRKSVQSFYNNQAEQHSPPKYRNTSKSDLSLQSENFHENFHSYGYEDKPTILKNDSNCSLDEIKSGGDNNVYVPLASVETYDEKDDHRNDITTLPAEPDSDDEEEPFYTQPQTINEDSISYESPNITFEPIEIDHSCIGQSTPKKDVYLTKCDTRDDNLMEDGYDTVDSPHSSSFQPPTNENAPIKEENQRATSLKNINNNSLTKYRNIKDKIRRSLRKSKTYLKNESRRLSHSLSNNFDTESYWDQSNLGLAELCDLESSVNSVHDQLEKAVNICRQAPELECSEEMVEAERLLLFSTIKARTSSDEATPIMHSAIINSLLQIDSFELSIKQDINKDEFFKYYYTGVFSIGRDIKSTQSSESRNNKVFFNNCNILFENVQQNSEIKCDIYMLRLRKIMNSALTMSPRDKMLKKNDKIDRSNSNGSSDEVMSRFRLQGSFICRPIDFVPFHLNVVCDRNIPDNKFCLHSENQCTLEITKISRTTNLKNEVRLLGKLKMYFQQFRLEGFLNYAKLNCKYNWNRQWCKLDKLNLFFWNYPQESQLKQSNFSINLVQCLSVTIADRELCSKPRSFIVNYKTENELQSILFSTDTQYELDYWLNGLNDVIAFTQKWMKV